MASKVNLSRTGLQGFPESVAILTTVTKHD